MCLSFRYDVVAFMNTAVCLTLQNPIHFVKTLQNPIHCYMFLQIVKLTSREPETILVTQKPGKALKWYRMVCLFFFVFNFPACWLLWLIILKLETAASEQLLDRGRRRIKST